MRGRLGVLACLVCCVVLVAPSVVFAQAAPYIAPVNTGPVVRNVNTGVRTVAVDLAAANDGKWTSRNISISAASTRSLARGALRYGGYAGLLVSAALDVYDLYYDDGTTGLDSKQGEIVANGIYVPSGTYGTLPPRWDVFGEPPDECWLLGCLVQGRGIGDARLIEWMTYAGPSSEPPPEWCIVGGQNIVNFSLGVRACLIGTPPGYPATVGEWNALGGPVTQPSTVLPLPGRKTAVDDEYLNQAIDSALLGQVIAEAIRHGYWYDTWPELVEAIDSLADALNQSSPNYNPDIEKNMLPGSPVLPAQPTSPEGSPSGEAGELELPGFCEWASIVCDLAQWFMDEPAEPETPDVPFVDATDDLPTFDSGLGAGSCPAPVSTAFMGQTIELSYSTACSALQTYFRPVLLLIAYVVAGTILVGARI